MNEQQVNQQQGRSKARGNRSHISLWQTTLKKLASNSSLLPKVNIVFFAPNVARRWWYCATAQNNVS
jgi:hypothetical protein